jgi:hypothetical protein
MADSKFVKEFPKLETEIRFAETPKDTWPNYAVALGRRGYWYGNHQNHKHIGYTEQEAREYLELYGLEF